MEELQLVDNCKYDLKGYIYFTANTATGKKQYKIHAKSALEIAYALFDSVGHSYKPLEDIEDELI